MPELSARILIELLNHATRWLSNLRRANSQRQIQSIKALRKVITASRETAVYLRQLASTRKSDHATERHLAVLWTELGFALEDLGLDRLAKRCHVTGKHWSDPTFYDQDFLAKADVSLERMEQIARNLLSDLER
jgi:hypothetical protein